MKTNDKPFDLDKRFVLDLDVDLFGIVCFPMLEEVEERCRLEFGNNV